MRSLGCFFLGLTYALALGQLALGEDVRKTYIVYMGDYPENAEDRELLHNSMVQNVLGSSLVEKHVLHHYKRSINGFVVKLTEEEAHRMAELDGVVSVFPNEKRELLTTKSWDFIGFPQHVERTNYESNIIVGVIDTGVWPESESFNDKGFGPPPSKWKGTCQTSNVTCNNKIIGARYFKSNDNLLSTNDIRSPRDTDGHGTHTTSTIAGNPLGKASMLGLAQGTSRGGVPSARIAVYKACWSGGCDHADLLAAFEAAIADGVDILSVSIGGKSQENYFEDSLAIGSFHAMRHGILVVFAAGNYGPKPSSIVNVSPWSIVVAAGTINRKFVTRVQLGNNRIFEGISLNTFDLKGRFYSLIYAGDAPNTKAGFDGNSSRLCSTNSLDNKLVNGKIVLCDGNPNALEVLKAGVVGILTSDLFSKDVAYSSSLPTCDLTLKDSKNTYQYIRSTRTPTATIFKTNELTDTLAPRVAPFSSRGPSLITPEILKPDLIAPGVDIIASWSLIAPVSEDDTRHLQFNIISGTSMACPHVSGAAVYVKSFHPMWSPAAIRSALMTTAKELSAVDHSDAEFAYGAGQIDPLEAVNPGLVYDASESDYIKLLCGQGYNLSYLRAKFANDVNCFNKSYTARDLNYPSFTLKAPTTQSNVSGSFKRTVTNVGSPIATYKAIVTSPPGLNIEVKPSVLAFTSLGQQQKFVLTIYGDFREIGASSVSASLVWSDGTFRVRSPIILYNVPVPSEAESRFLVRGTYLYYLNYIALTMCTLIILYYYY